MKVSPQVKEQTRIAARIASDHVDAVETLFKVVSELSASVEVFFSYLEGDMEDKDKASLPISTQAYIAGTKSSVNRAMEGMSKEEIKEIVRRAIERDVIFGSIVRSSMSTMGVVADTMSVLSPHGLAVLHTLATLVAGIYEAGEDQSADDILPSVTEALLQLVVNAPLLHEATEELLDSILGASND